MSMSLVIREVRAHRFVADGRTVFTLTDGIISGRVRRDGGTAPYSVSALEVLKKFLETANAQEAAMIRALAEDRLEKVAA